MSFLWELKRRNIFIVGIAYAIFVWFLVQIVSRIFTAQNLPAWAITLVTALLVVGLPVVLFFTWIVTGKSIAETEKPSASGGDILVPNTIAVLPFVDLSPESDHEYFVDGLSEELLNSLTKISDLRVTARTSSFAFKGSDKSVQEIADLLGVEHILEGSVRKADTALRITAQLVRAADGFYLWSKTYDRSLQDIFAVQEDIAMAVARELSETLGIEASLKQLGGTENVEAYELYLFAQGQIGEGDLTALSRGLKSIDAAVAKDPVFGLAWARKAVVHNFLSVNVPANRVAAELDAGLHAAQKAIELEPDLAEAYAAMGYNRALRGDWIEAESAYSKAFELATKPIFVAVPSIPLHYLAVGFFKKAHELLEDIRRDDAFNNPNRAWYFFSYGLLGNVQRAEEEFDRGRALFGEEWHWGNFFITLLRLGIGDIDSENDILISDPINNVSRELLESPEEALRELRRFFIDYDNQDTGSLPEISVWAAYFGDPEFAMDAMEKAVNLNAINAVYLWLPMMHEVRQMPRFKEFIREIGLVDYWNKFGWPDICHQLDNGDFECD